MQLQHESERRQIVRHSVRVPVQAGGIWGTTVNVSAGGVLFESPLSTRVGEPIEFTLALSTQPAAPMMLVCRGRVVRASSTRFGMAVAATIDSLESN